MSNELKKLGLINTKDKVLYATLGVLAGLGTIALFYFLVTELQRVFN